MRIACGRFPVTTWSSWDGSTTKRSATCIAVRALLCCRGKKTSASLPLNRSPAADPWWPWPAAAPARPCSMASPDGWWKEKTRPGLPARWLRSMRCPFHHPNFTTALRPTARIGLTPPWPTSWRRRWSAPTYGEALQQALRRRARDFRHRHGGGGVSARVPHPVPDRPHRNAQGPATPRSVSGRPPLRRLYGAGGVPRAAALSIPPQPVAHGRFLRGARWQPSHRAAGPRRDALRADLSLERRAQGSGLPRGVSMG